MAMTTPEMQTGRLLRKTAVLLNSVAEAAWTNDTPSPARWDLHRIGTAAYLAQRDILVTLSQGEVPAAPLLGVDIAGALEEAAQTLAAIPQEFHNLDTERMEGRVASLARRAVALATAPVLTGR
jgi:hypothetical protein